MRDMVASTSVAVRTLQIVHPNLFDVGCLSHALDRVGEYFDLPILNEFMTSWIIIFSHSPKAKLVWRE